MGIFLLGQLDNWTSLIYKVSILGTILLPSSTSALASSIVAFTQSEFEYVNNSIVFYG